MYRESVPSGFRTFLLAVSLAAVWPCLPAQGQIKPDTSLGTPRQTSTTTAPQSEAELRTGIDLTNAGRFREAIPHFLAARGHVADEYAASFNLALCYVATGQFQPALAVLRELEQGGRAKAEVYSLLAQALIGNSQPEEGFEAFQKAVALQPKNEKLYLFVADACMGSQEYNLGLKVLNVGVQHLPESPRLHHEKGIFYSFVDDPDSADREFELVAKIAPGSVIASLATAQKGLLDGDTPETIRAAREGVRKDPDNYILLAILGQALIRNGVAPGQPEFEEARKALERSVEERPDYWVSQQALGQIYVMMNRPDDAIEHLENARQISPGTPSVYSNLARAYRQRGDQEQARKMLKVLAGLNRQQAAKYKLAPPDHMASYMGSRQQQ